MVLNGIDTIEDYQEIFRGKRLGLITSVSGVNRQLESTVRVLSTAFTVSALFSPEHGIRGDIEAGDAVDTYRDPHTGISVYSLYRPDSKRFTGEMLAQTDALVYDIQDLGTRYYTFISTLLYALESCAAYGKPLIVLDRIDPLGGTVVEGNLLDQQFSSFVGCYPLCIRYGLTPGEFALMVNTEKALGCDLTVIPCRGWKRSMLFPETGLAWMMPSMGIPRFETALLYPGMCLFEGTDLSEGRGTSCPFELIGAPYVDAQSLCDEMNACRLPGVRFTPAYFKPSSSKYAGIQCSGVHAHVLEISEASPVRTGLELLDKIHEMYSKDFHFLPSTVAGKRPFIEYLLGMDVFSKGFPDTTDLLDRFGRDSIGFTERKHHFHLYM